MDLAAAAGAALLLLHRVSVDVPEAYMDEIFHGPQAAAYCEGRWDHWDPKITTFPGLYLVSAFFSSALLRNGSCSLMAVRAVSAGFYVGAAVLLRALVGRRVAGLRGQLTALSLSLFPFHFFFSALAYTDAGSTFWVLLLWWVSETRPRSALAVLLASTCAVLFRQTNVVWVVFSAATAAIADLQAAHGADVGVFRALSLLLKEWRRFTRLLWPQAVVVVAFAAFVAANGGIVVGDKDNHAASLHWAQLGYFSLVGSAYLLARPTGLVAALQALRSRWLLPALALAALGLHYGSAVHPFLLADNRHYTFYVWQRWFLRVPHAALLSLPAYAVGAVVLGRALRECQSGLWAIAYAVCVAAVLVPSPLVEPRYYVVPFLIGGVATAPLISQRLPLAVNLGAALAVNAATLYVFLRRPFTWGDGSEARFMW